MLAHSSFSFYFFGCSFLVSYVSFSSATQQLSVSVPQNSVLGPPLFALYTFHWENINSHEFSCLYTDKSQICISGTDHTSEWQIWIWNCLQDTSVWMSQRHPQVIQYVQDWTHWSVFLTWVYGSIIHPVTQVIILGPILDSYFSLIPPIQSANQILRHDLPLSSSNGECPWPQMQTS